MRLIHMVYTRTQANLQRPVPAALRELYADRALVTSGGPDYSKAGAISTFNPLCEEGLLDTREQVGSDVVAFATSGCGDPIYLRPGVSETDKVYIAYHDDPGNVQVFADSVAELLERLRYANHDT